MSVLATTAKTPKKKVRNSNGGRWRNNLRHGLRSRNLRGIPHEPEMVKARNRLRCMFEDDLLQAGREIGVAEAARIAAATASYEYAMKCGHWLVDNHDDLTHEQRIMFAKGAQDGYAEVARHAKALGIERSADGPDTWDISLPADTVAYLNDSGAQAAASGDETPEVAGNVPKYPTVPQTATQATRREASAMTVIGTSPTRKKRRTKAEIQAIRDTICEVVAEERAMTVRQVFYHGEPGHH